MMDMLSARYRWMRDDKHFLPGAGETPTGYVVAQAPTAQPPPSRSPDDISTARRQLESVWDA